jgi:hypothetical protein
VSKIVSNMLAKEDLPCMDSLKITIHYVTDFVHVGKRNTISREKA